MDFDNHVTRLQKEMVDITQNLNKFKNKNHKIIFQIINNLNVLTNEMNTNGAIKYNNKNLSPN